MKTNAVPFDQNAIGPGLTLSVNDTILQTSADVDEHRHARSQFGQASVKSAVEFYIYSPNAVTPSLAPSSAGIPLLVGIVYPGADLAKYVGEDAYGMGYCPGDGNVYQNGAVIETFATRALNSYIGVMVDFVALSITFYMVKADGAMTTLGTLDIPAATDIWYAATVSGNPGDLGIWANAGQTPLRSRNLVGGWYHLGIGIEPLYLATEPYISSPTDLIPHFKYSGDMEWKESQIAISRGVRFWPWGPSAPTVGGSQIQFTINDPKKIYGDLMSEDIRDQLALFSRLPHNTTFDANAQAVFSAIIDKCEQPTDQTKVLHCKDKLVLLESQLIRAMFPPNADPSVAGKPRPMSLGICRTYSPSLYEALSFAASDTPITGIGKLREQGKELAYGIDATITPDAESFTRADAPAGKWTVETTDFGGSFDPGATDILNGDGDFGSVVSDGGGTSATSHSSITIGTGAKVFATVADTTIPRYFQAGDTVTVSATSGNTMTGTVTSFISGTLTLSIASVTGSGTFDFWNISNPASAHSNSSAALTTGAKTFAISSFAGFNTTFVIGSAITLTASGGSLTGTVVSPGYTAGNVHVNITSTAGAGGPYSSWSIVGGQGQPHNWIGFGGYPTDPGSIIFQVKGTSPNKYVEQEQYQEAVYGIRHATLIINPGQTIAFEVDVKLNPLYGSGFTDTSGKPIVVAPALLAFGGIPSFSAFKSTEWTRFSVPNVGAFRGTFTNTDSKPRPLCLALICNEMTEGGGGRFSYLQLNSIKLIALPDLLTNVALSGPGLAVILRSLLIDHGPLEPGDYTNAGARIIDANGYQYGLHISPDDAPQVYACARLLLDSACADIYVDRSGFVLATQLIAPEDETTVDGTLTENKIQGFLQPIPDLAENLTTRMSGCKNYDPYSESDFANVSQSDVPQLVRKQLEQPFQWTVTANAVLATRYASADNTKPLESQLDLQTDGQKEITRVCALYSVPRNFYVCTVFSPIGTQYDIGDVLLVTYPISGLETGRQLLVVGMTERPTDSTTQLVMWGL